MPVHHIEDNEAFAFIPHECDSHVMEWHSHNTNRYVRVVYGSSWGIQFEGEVPIQVQEGDTIVIPAGVTHRLIRGVSGLILRQLHDYKGETKCRPHLTIV